MTRVLFFTFFLACAVGLFLAANSSFGFAEAGEVSPLVPTKLRCGFLTDPLGIDNVRPSLSWISVSRNPEIRGQRQSAYQIQVASSDAALIRRPDLWDSSRVVSDDSIEIKYAGQLLRSNMRCVWRVRVWDGAGRVSAWSAPALWTMGVLSPSEWKARWIDAAPRRSQWADFTLETSFTIQREAAGVYFRASGAGQAYMWQISVVGGKPVLRSHARINGFYQVLKTVPLGSGNTAADFQTPHHLRIEASGKTITTFLDGHLIDTTIDGQRGAGSIGFRESATEAATFRSIRVTDPSGRELYKDDFPATGRNSFSGGTIGVGGLTVTNADAMLESGNLRTPMLRHEFSVTTSPIRRAWLYASSLGIYEANINGTRVGDRFYAPGWTNYYRRVQYQCYDVTSSLRRGGNAIGVQLAPGWYCGKIAWFGPNQYGADAPKFFAELHIEYADGRTQVVATDGSWKFASGPIVEADNLDGESYDARLEHPGWDRPGLDDSAWHAAHLESVPSAIALVAQMDPPIRSTQIVPAEAVSQPSPGVYIYKLQQDITGVARVRITGKTGTTATVRQGEVLNPDGTLNLITLESPGIPGARAEAIDRYTFGRNGTAEFQPEFTFHGFQYIEISGVAEQPALKDVVGVVYGTDVPHIGALATSSGFVNQLQSDVQWSGRDAFMSAPMDCPQRSERLGWTGDANFYVATAAFNFDMAAFYEKWERDMLSDGPFSNAAPSWFAGDAQGTGGGWGDAGVNVPFVLWQNYGDTDIIRSSFDAMARWITFLKSQGPGLITNGAISAPGDWKNSGESTPQDLIATAYFAYDTKQLSIMAAAIGRADDARKYADLFERIKAAFIAKFVKPDGVVGSGSQTSYVMALNIRLLPEGLVQAAGRNLATNVDQHHNHLTTGFVGTQWLLPVLTQIGRSDLAYAVLGQTTQPSWGYMMAQKMTTIWETWDVMAADGTFPHGPFSLNHCALGSCGEWLYHAIGGIAPDPEFPGYKRFVVHPEPQGSGLSWASASYQSPYGTITTHWQVRPSDFALDVVVPLNTEATVYVPAVSETAVREGASDWASHARGIHFQGRHGGSAVFTVESGTYHFTSKLPSAPATN